MSESAGRKVFLLLNAIGGSAVLGSYAWTLLSRPIDMDGLWGGTPEGIRPFYGVFMVLAAVGYFFFTAFFLRRLRPDSCRRFGVSSWSLLGGLYGAVFVASALWMPLTAEMLQHPGEGLWLAIRVVLLVVGGASLALLVVLLTIDVDRSGWLYPAAVAGLIAFCVQTAVLDALVWPSFFR